VWLIRMGAELAAIDVNEPRITSGVPGESTLYGRYQISPSNDKKNNASVWRAIAMITCNVASAMIFLNEEESRIITTLEYADQRTMPNAETSDMTGSSDDGNE
jgi:hypothetical protein